MKNAKSGNPLFLIESKDKYFFPYLDERLFFTFKQFKKHTFVNRFFEKKINRFISKHPKSLIAKIICVLSIRFFYSNKLIKLIKQSSFIVFFDNTFRNNIVFYSNLVKSGKTFVYTWNVIDRSILNYWNKIICLDRIATYSKKDSAHYSLPYIRSPYVKTNISISRPSYIDVYYMGRLKPGRLSYILKLFDFLALSGFKCRVDLLIDNESPISYPKRDYLRIIENFISYEDYLSYVQLSNCLVDLTYPENPNSTLRTIESIFYNQKLITTDTSIKLEPFYNPDNVFIVDINKIDGAELTAFLARPFSPFVSKPIVDLFSIDTFINAFKHLLNN